MFVCVCVCVCLCVVCDWVASIGLDGGASRLLWHGMQRASSQEPKVATGGHQLDDLPCWGLTGIATVRLPPLRTEANCQKSKVAP